MVEQHIVGKFALSDPHFPRQFTASKLLLSDICREILQIIQFPYISVIREVVLTMILFNTQSIAFAFGAKTCQYTKFLENIFCWYRGRHQTDGKVSEQTSKHG